MYIQILNGPGVDSYAGYKDTTRTMMTIAQCGVEYLGGPVAFTGDYTKYKNIIGSCILKTHFASKS
jgi:hypothetical protein